MQREAHDTPHQTKLGMLDPVECPRVTVLLTCADSAARLTISELGAAKDCCD